MLQSKARLLELNAKLAETLTSKGVTATADETTTALVNKVANITSGDDSVLRGLIQRDLTDLIIPYGTVVIGESAFRDYRCLINVTIPNSVKNITLNAFAGCSKLTNVTIPNSVKSIGNYAFNSCPSLTNVTIPNSVTSIGAGAFNSCTNLKNVTIPNSVKSIGNSAFYNCSKLTDVTLGDGFNANTLDLSASTLYSRETILQWLNALADRTGQTAYKLTIGAKNLAKLTEQDILIATNKNWTLS